MGKKKGKKGSGKKKGGKKKKSSEPQITFKEALLAYQINIKEKHMEDVQFELRALEEKNQRHKERNKRLKQEQAMYLQKLLKDVKDYEKKLESEVPVTKDEVVLIMQDKWKVNKQETRDLESMTSQISNLDQAIFAVQKELSYWSDYKGRGQQEHQTQIRLLEQELVDMQKSSEEIAVHLEKTLSVAKEEIQKFTNETLDKQKGIATEKAMTKMDKYSRQEIMDSDWLKKEVEIHQFEEKSLMEVVEEYEKENLEIMSELFECTVEDLKISRDFFLTQFEEQENLDETGILEMDLSKVSLRARDPDSNPLIVEETYEETKKRQNRPKSATVRAIEEKLFTVENKIRKPWHLAPDSEPESENSDYDGINDDEVSEASDPYDNQQLYEDEEFGDYLKLGPLELKLLNVTGQKIPIYQPLPLPADEAGAKAFCPDTWPVTPTMLSGAITPRNPIWP